MVAIHVVGRFIPTVSPFMGFTVVVVCLFEGLGTLQRSLSVAISSHARHCTYRFSGAPNAPGGKLSWNRRKRSTCVFKSTKCEVDKTSKIIEIGSQTKKLEAIEVAAKMERKAPYPAKIDHFSYEVRRTRS